MADRMLKDYLDIAIEREEEAYQFYKALSLGADNNQAKEALDFLAGQELGHKKFLQEYKSGKLDKDTLRLTDVVDYKIAEYIEKPDIEKDMQGMDVYLVAAHRELNSYNFYKQLAAIHPEGSIKDMFLKMANEELKHKEKVEYLYSNSAFAQTEGG